MRSSYRLASPPLPTTSFARLFSWRLLCVDARILGTVLAPTGPGITRFGSGIPWPWDRYAGQVS